MKFDILHNFISPVTGRVLADPDYVLVGDRLGIATPSPMLIDIRLELNNLRQTIKDMQLPELEYKQIWTGNNDNKAIATTKLDIDNLPDLSTNKVWQGDAQGRPSEVELQIAPNDASYIIQVPNIDLPNAQALSLLGTGIAKIIEGGEVAIAIPDEDYATKETLEKIRDETEILKDEAEAAADEATGAAEEATASAAEATGAAAEATGAAGASILGGIGSVLGNLFGGGDGNNSNTTNIYNNDTVNSSGGSNDLYGSLSDSNFPLAEQNIKNANLQKITSIEQDTNYLQNNIASNSDNLEDSLQQMTKFTDFINQKSRTISLHAEAANESSFIAEDAAQQAASYLNILNNSGIILTGDITGNGALDSTIVTSFRQNPKFYGSEAVQIPFGNSTDRPNEANIGMLRYNTDYEAIEYYNNSIWSQLESNKFAITYPYATDMVYGIINNVNGIFDGFSSLERDLDVKIKSSYYTGELNDSSSASLSVLDRYNNGYINKTISSNNGFFDYLLQQQDSGLKVDLLKFDNKIDEFIFYKPISCNGKNIIKYDEAVDIVTGVLNNSNGLFSGFTTDNQDIDIKIKTAHFAKDNYSSSSLSFLNRYNNGYIFSNKTNADWSNEFSFSSINAEVRDELFKYDPLTSKFIFNKLVEVPTPINDADAANKYYVDNAAAGVKDVLGTNGQIFSSGGQYPQISLVNTGVTAGNYILANINIDATGRIMSASNGEAVTSITGGFGLDGGTITTTGTLSLSDSGVLPGTYARANISVDSKGRITAASNGEGVNSITAGSGLTGGTITDSGIIGLSNTGVNADSYTNPNLTINSHGRITSASNGSAVTSIYTGYGLSGGPITSSGTISLSNSGVVAGAYNAASVTVDSAGRVTHAKEARRIQEIYFQNNFIYTPSDPVIGSSKPIVVSTPLINEFGVYLTYGGYDVNNVTRKDNGGYLYVNSQQQLIFKNANNSYVIAG